jgi:2-methylisocitrate lyase-like PEP mutase family enzyme
MNTRDRFRLLHESGFFVMPNAWDIGSAVRFEHLGFAALGTTSSGFAASLGRRDQQTSFAELCAHVQAMVDTVDVPISVDGERLFAEAPRDLRNNAETVERLGAAGLSIEDYDPGSASIDPIDRAVERVAVVAEVTRPAGMVLTARAENHLYGIDDLDDTIIRLQRFVAAGADVVYAPGLESAQDIERVVTSSEAPVNVLLRPAGPPPTELASLGVRRASTGGRLAFAAYEAASALARALLQ